MTGSYYFGAYFGDKLSPLSDTTNIAPAMAGTDLFTHTDIWHLQQFLHNNYAYSFCLLGFTLDVKEQRISWINSNTRSFCNNTFSFNYTCYCNYYEVIKNTSINCLVGWYVIRRICSINCSTRYNNKITGSKVLNLEPYRGIMNAITTETLFEKRW